MALEQERKTLQTMLQIYCKHHHDSDSLCDACNDLLAYAEQRLSKCPFGEEKPSCRRCEIHCYAADMRQRIAAVMRFSGPRMALRDPVGTVRHLLRTTTRQSKVAP